MERVRPIASEKGCWDREHLQSDIATSKDASTNTNWPPDRLRARHTLTNPSVDGFSNMWGDTPSLNQSLAVEASSSRAKRSRPAVSVDTHAAWIHRAGREHGILACLPFALGDVFGVTTLPLFDGVAAKFWPEARVATSRAPCWGLPAREKGLGPALAEVLFRDGVAFLGM